MRTIHGLAACPRTAELKIIFDIKNKVALVTGANRGIGKAIVEAFLDHGADKVYAAVRRPDSVAPLIERYGDRVLPVQLDLTKPETIAAMAAIARDVQVVVNNAAIFKSATPLDDDAIEALELGMKINVIGLIRVAQAFAPILKQNGGGAFVQLNSVASLVCASNFATHSACKAAAYSITLALHELLGQQGTAVLSVHPGLIASEMGTAAGLAGSADPPSVVAEGIVSALKAGDFLLFPDSIAKRVGNAYRSFFESVVEAGIPEYKPKSENHADPVEK
jgi:NAD(P)-dependent dehydrogenase (short-subunit alcohol dehydrogenase family)